MTGVNGAGVSSEARLAVALSRNVELLQMTSDVFNTSSSESCRSSSICLSYLNSFQARAKTPSTSISAPPWTFNLISSPTCRFYSLQSLRLLFILAVHTSELLEGQDPRVRKSSIEVCHDHPFQRSRQTFSLIHHVRSSTHTNALGEASLSISRR